MFVGNFLTLANVDSSKRMFTIIAGICLIAMVIAFVIKKKMSK
ncbi:MAG: hypothetical protein PT934_06930 [Peptoniphilaceae bacterium]|nr:hypothetical protein [Parvimonas sp.]MDD7765484.1 hypothetical protein [Peptoniphilaceae bacterium]MDY3051025.1 hypothetical protein [Parvimonas sp.]